MNKKKTGAGAPNVTKPNHKRAYQDGKRDAKTGCGKSERYLNTGYHLSYLDGYRDGLQDPDPFIRE